MCGAPGPGERALTRVAVRFDEACLVPNAGLLPVAALAGRVDLAGLIDTRARLASEAANSATKALTVIGSDPGRRGRA